MASFTVPYTDHQIEVDPGRRLVMLYRNAWNRESCGTPDETYPFEALLADEGLMLLLTIHEHTLCRSCFAGVAHPS